MLNDFLFTKLFGEKVCEKETLHLINTFTKRNFKSLNYKSNEFKGEHKDNKKSITDVLVEMNDKSIVNIESQIKKQKKFHKRIQFYNSRIYSIQLKIGESHEKLPMTFMINFLGFNLHKLEDYHTIFMLCEKNNREYVLDDLIELHYIELTKLRKKAKKCEVDLNNPKDRFALLLDIKTPKSLIEKVIKMDEVAKNIHDKISNILKDQDQYLAYIRADQAERDHEGQLRYAEEKGIEKGKRKEKIELAINLKKDGIPIEQIARNTDLSIEFIEEI